MGRVHSSDINHIDISADMICELNNTRLIYINSTKSKTEKYLYFADDICSGCITILSDVKNNNKSAVIYYSKSTIYAIRPAYSHWSHISSKVSVTSTGYKLHKKIIG